MFSTKVNQFVSCVLAFAALIFVILQHDELGELLVHGYFGLTIVAGICLFIGMTNLILLFDRND